MGKRTKGFEWIGPGDSQLLAWALNHLISQGRLKHSPKGEPPTYEKLLELGSKLEQTAEGQLLLTKMKNAWRTEKKRIKDREAGLQSYTFTLPMKAYDQLRALAARQSQAVGACLEKMISSQVAEIERMQGEQSKLKTALKEALQQKELMHKTANEYGKFLERYVRLHCQHEIPSNAENREDAVTARYKELEEEIKAAVKKVVHGEHPAEPDSDRPPDEQQHACEISRPQQGASVSEAGIPQGARCAIQAQNQTPEALRPHAQPYANISTTNQIATAPDGRLNKERDS